MLEHTYCFDVPAGGQVLVVAQTNVPRIENQCQRSGMPVKDAHAHCILRMQTESPMKSALRQSANPCHKYTFEYGIHFVSSISSMTEGVRQVKAWVERFPAAHGSQYIQDLQGRPKDPG